MNEKIDLRIIKTKKSIYDALKELMYEKSFEEIRVSEICEKALINRSTFYAHFEDKYDLLDNLVKDLNEEFEVAIKMRGTFKDLREYYERQLIIVLDYIDTNKEIYQKMANKNRNSVAMNMIYDTLKKAFADRTKEIYKGSVPVDVITTYFIGGIFNLLLAWLENPNYKKEELLEYVEPLIFSSKIFEN